MPFGTRLGVAFATLILAGAPAWAGTDISKLSKQCAKGNQNACAELAQIAQDGKNSVTMRRWATSNLRDQEVLAKIGASDEDSKVRHEALAQLRIHFSSQPLNSTTLELIGRIALNGKDPENRRDAVSFLVDQSLLTNIATDDADPGVRSDAMNKLHDQSSLVKLAISSQRADARSEALSRVSDQTLIAEVALQGADPTTRLNAVDKLTDESILANVATVSTDPEVRAAAVWKSGDSSLVDKVARQDNDALVRDAARASVWRTVKNEHEVYIWRSPSPDTGGAANSRWIISGTVGVASLTEDTSQSSQTDITSVVAASNASSEAARVDETGRLYLSLEPENDDDILHLDSGTLPINLGESTKDMTAPFEFQGRRIGGSGVWKMTENRAVMYLRPTLLMEANHQLELGGSYKASSDQSTGQYVGFNIRTGPLDWGPVLVKGNLRLRPNEVLSIGTRLEAKGGAIQFDGTGAFLSPGSLYRGVGK
jgi:hypothetical protein